MHRSRRKKLLRVSPGFFVSSGAERSNFGRQLQAWFFWSDACTARMSLVVRALGKLGATTGLSLREQVAGETSKIRRLMTERYKVNF